MGLRSNKTAFGTFREELFVIMAGSDGILGRSFFPPLSLEYKSHKIENNEKLVLK